MYINNLLPVEDTLRDSWSSNSLTVSESKFLKIPLVFTFRNPFYDSLYILCLLYDRRGVLGYLHLPLNNNTYRLSVNPEYTRVSDTIFEMDVIE